MFHGVNKTSWPSCCVAWSIACWSVGVARDGRGTGWDIRGLIRGTRGRVSCPWGRVRCTRDRVRRILSLVRGSLYRETYSMARLVHCVGTRVPPAIPPIGAGLAAATIEKHQDNTGSSQADQQDVVPGQGQGARHFQRLSLGEEVVPEQATTFLDTGGIGRMAHIAAALSGGLTQGPLPSIIADDRDTPEVVLHQHLFPVEGVEVVAALHGEAAPLHLNMTAAGFWIGQVCQGCMGCQEEHKKNPHLVAGRLEATEQYSVTTHHPDIPCEMRYLPNLMTSGAVHNCFLTQRHKLGDMFSCVN